MSDAIKRTYSTTHTYCHKKRYLYTRSYETQILSKYFPCAICSHFIGLNCVTVSLLLKSGRYNTQKDARCVLMPNTVLCLFYLWPCPAALTRCLFVPCPLRLEARFYSDEVGKNSNCYSFSKFTWRTTTTTIINEEIYLCIQCLHNWSRSYLRVENCCSTNEGHIKERWKAAFPYSNGCIISECKTIGFSRLVMKEESSVILHTFSI